VEKADEDSLAFCGIKVFGYYDVDDFKEMGSTEVLSCAVDSDKKLYYVNARCDNYYQRPNLNVVGYDTLCGSQISKRVNYWYLDRYDTQAIRNSGGQLEVSTTERADNRKVTAVYD